MKIKNCRLCGGEFGPVCIDMGSTSLANQLVTSPKPQNRYPLEVVVCRDCRHVQLNELIDPTVLFGNYSFTSGVSQINIDHFNQYAVDTLKKHPLPKGEKVLEVASNDGTLLKAFKSLGMEVLGIEPAANIAALANKDSIPTECCFFNEAEAIRLRSKHGTFKIICANNVFAHVEDLIGFTKGIKQLLHREGVFILEVAYLIDMIKNLDAFQIYHEHLDYWTIESFLTFFQQQGMEVRDVERTSPQGGSLRVTVGFPSGKGWKKREEWLLEEEGIENQLKDFADKIVLLGKKLRDLLFLYREQHKTVALFGVSAKSTTLLQTFGLGDLIDVAIDTSFLKQGKYTSGTHILIESPNILYNEKIDVIVIGAWNFAKGIMKNHKDWNGRWILPLPSVKIIDGGV